MAHLFNKGIYYITNGTDPNTLGLVPTNNAGLAKTEDGSSTWRYDDALPTNKWVLDNLDRYNAHIVGTAPYDPLLPLTGWVAPSNPIAGNTVEVKFTDGTVGNYTFDGSVWGLDFVIEPFNVSDETACTTFDERIVVKKTDGSYVARPTGSIKNKEVFPTGNYTALQNDEIIYAKGGSTITLPSPIGKCSEITIYRDACSDGLITVNVAGGLTIDGVHTTRTLEVGRGAFTYEVVNGEWRIKSDFFEQDQSCALFSLLNSNNANVTVFTLDGQPYSVDWGDGTNSGPIASGVATSKSYGSAFTGNVSICKTCGVAPIFDVRFNTGNWNFDISVLNQFPNLARVDIYSGVTTGDIANLPSGLTFYINSGQNTTSGDIANLPSGLTYHINGGQNTTSGDIGSLPNGLTYYSNSGQNTTSGNIANLPSGLTSYYNYGQNTTSGNIANLPIGLTGYVNYGQNTTNGDIANLPSTMTVYVNRGQNTVSDYSGGNLNSGITRFDSFSANSTFNSTEVDNLLIELASTLPGITYVRIAGGAAPPTAASLAARNQLIAAGTTLITN